MIVTKEFLKAAKEATGVSFQVDKLKKGLQGTIKLSKKGNGSWPNQELAVDCLAWIMNHYNMDRVSTYTYEVIYDMSLWKAALANIRAGDDLSFTANGEQYSGDCYMDTLTVSIERQGKAYRHYKYMLVAHPYNTAERGNLDRWYDREDYKARKASIEVTAG